MSGLGPVTAFWIVAFALIAPGLLLDRPPALRAWLEMDFEPWLLYQSGAHGLIGCYAIALAAFFVMIAVHELGHVLAGVPAGFRFRSVRAGPILFSRPFRFTFVPRLETAFNGVADLIPATPSDLRWRAVAMVFAGPAANFVSAALVLLWPSPPGAFAGFFAAFSILNGISDLVPFESPAGVSDGRRIAMLLRRRDQGERWLAILRLTAEVHEGVEPRAYSADLLAKASVIRDPSRDTVIGHALAYSAAWQQKQIEAAAQSLETCLRYAGWAAPALREALMSDAAVFQGRTMKRVDLAEQWLGELPGRPQVPWFRWRAEAAVLEARGDVNGALEKLAGVEAVFRALPASAQRETLLRMLETWKSDLSRGQPAAEVGAPNA